MSRRKLEPNQIVVEGELIYIHLVGKNGNGKVAVTDSRSFLRFNLGKLTWYIDNHGYACAWDSELKKNVWMHRLVSENTSSLHSDHINRNRLDNRSENLRICNAKNNNYNAEVRKDNKYGFKNTTLYQGSFRCMIRINKVKQYFGSYSKPEMAGLAYNLAMDFIAPDYAALNEIPEGRLTIEEVELVQKTVNRRLEKIYGVQTNQTEDKVSRVEIIEASGFSFVKNQLIDKIV